MGTRSSAKTLAYLQIVRFPNLFTAIADILAGYFIVCGSEIGGTDLFFLALSSISIYAAGCVLNDLCDSEIDARERPFRPIPSGRISKGQALGLLLVLFTAGLLCAFRVGWTALLVAALLSVLVLSYDTLTRSLDFYGPVNMAACRSLNLLLGMSPGIFWKIEVVLFPLVTLVYVFSLTTLSRFEVDGAPDSRKWHVLLGWTTVGILIAWFWQGRHLPLSGLLFLAIFICWTGPHLLAAILKPAPDRVSRAVKAMILGIPLLDAVYSSAVQGMFHAVIVALLILPAIVLARYVYVT